jgi:membrane protein
VPPSSAVAPSVNVVGTGKTAGSRGDGAAPGPGSFERLRERHRSLAVAFAVQKKASTDGAGNAAALITYYAFLSLFPLLLLAIAILGFVVHSNQAARNTILHSGLPNIPIVGATLSSGHLSGSAVAVAVGALGSLWAGLSIANTLQSTFNQINDVPAEARPHFVKMRLRSLRLLFAVGILGLGTIALTGLTSSGTGGAVVDVAGFAVALALNAVLFTVAFRLLTDDAVPTRKLWPGVVFATLGWQLIQALGGLYVHHVLSKASATYGSFAAVIGLLAWLHLGARVVVYAAELNSVLARQSPALPRSSSM